MTCWRHIFLSRNKLLFYLCAGCVLFVTRQTMYILGKQNIRDFSWIFDPTETLTLRTRQSGVWKTSSKSSPNPVKNDEWQAVGPNTLNSTLVFSAFHDGYKPAFVKVIGLCYVNETRPYFCQLWYPDLRGVLNEMRTSNASVVTIQEDEYEHLPCFIKCPLPDSRTPVIMSIVAGYRDSDSHNTLRVHYIANKTYTRNFTMCLSPLHNFDEPYRLVEWIELNSILGASHFNIYNFTSTVRIQTVLEFYIRQGIVSLHNWQLPVVIKGDKYVTSLSTLYNGQIAAYNDCLLRSKADSRFVVITDIDEFIIPRLNVSKTWQDVLDQLPFAVGYKFRHCYFNEAFDTVNFVYDRKQLSEQYMLNTLQYLRRLDKINPYVHRGKYMARTASAYDVCTHNMHAVDRVYLVDPSLAFLHHYRSYVDMSPGSIQYNVPIITDMTVLDKYGDELLKRVVTVWAKITVNNQAKRDFLGVS